MQDFKKLIVWQKAHAMMIDIYQVVEVFPKEVLFGITKQLKDASLSVEANIAEGSAKPGDHEF